MNLQKVPLQQTGKSPVMALQVRDMFGKTWRQATT